MPLVLLGVVLLIAGAILGAPLLTWTGLGLIGIVVAIFAIVIAFFLLILLVVFLSAVLDERRSSRWRK